MDCSSVYRMAEVARMFGERRMCKLEVDMMSLDVTILCVEHELLFRALQPLQNLVSIYVCVCVCVIGEAVEE